MNNFFPRDVVRPNPECANNACLQKQALYQGWKPKEWLAKGHSTDPDEVIDHGENEWEIEVVGVDEPVESQSAKTAEGVEFLFSRKEEVYPFLKKFFKTIPLQFFLTLFNFLGS